MTFGKMVDDIRAPIKWLLTFLSSAVKGRWRPWITTAASRSVHEMYSIRSRECSTTFERNIGTTTGDPVSEVEADIAAGHDHGAAGDPLLVAGSVSSTPSGCFQSRQRRTASAGRR
jgi:hypothetical protein